MAPLRRTAANHPGGTIRVRHSFLKTYPHFPPRRSVAAAGSPPALRWLLAAAVFNYCIVSLQPNCAVADGRPGPSWPRSAAPPPTTPAALSGCATVPQ